MWPAGCLGGSPPSTVHRTGPLRALEQDPFGDDGRTKRALRASIAGSRAEKRAAYVAMRSRIAEARAARGAELDALRARIAANREALAANALAADRTWPFPMATA